jgi:predicted nucleotidyltransferase
VNLGQPLLDVVPGVRGSLLQVLVRLERPVTRRALALEAGVSTSQAHAVLDELAEAGIVLEETIGRAILVALNRDSLAARHVIGLAGIPRELADLLRRRLGDWDGLVAAYLFGSVARGDADRSSDVDVMIVVEDLDAPALHDRLGQLHVDVRAWTGNQLQIVEYDEASWRRLVRSQNPLVAELRRDGISLAGSNPQILVDVA